MAKKTSGKSVRAKTFEFEKELTEVNWSEYNTAYGSAETVETQLILLRSENSKIAMKAAHSLWCGLCHQHAYISSAALPAFPFLIDTYQQSEEKLKVELLDIFLGFAICLKRSKEPTAWEEELLSELEARSHLFLESASSENEEISSFGNEITLRLNSLD